MNVYSPVQPGLIILVISAPHPSCPSVPAASLPEGSRLDGTPACLSSGLSLQGGGPGGSGGRRPIPGSLAPPGLDSQGPGAHSPPRLSGSRWRLGRSAPLAVGSLRERSCVFVFRLLLPLRLRRGPGLSEQRTALSSDEPHVTVNRQKCLEATWTHVLPSPLPGPSQWTWFLGGLRASPPLLKPRPRADPGNGASGGGALWVISAQGSHRTPWCGQRGGLSSVRSCPFVPTTWPPAGCPVTHPHPQAAHSTALVPGSPGTHPDAQQFSLISFLLWFGKPLVGTAHDPSTYQVPTEKLPSGQKGFFLTPTFEFSAFSDFCVIRIKKKKAIHIK